MKTLMASPLQYLDSSGEERSSLLIPTEPLGQRIVHYRKQRKLTQKDWPPLLEHRAIVH